MGMEALVRAATRSAARKTGWFNFISVVFNIGFVGKGGCSLQTERRTGKARLLAIRSFDPTEWFAKKLAPPTGHGPSRPATKCRGCDVAGCEHGFGATIKKP